MTEDALPAETTPETLATNDPVIIAATAATPPVSISADEHQLIHDLKAAGHDLTVLYRDVVSKL